MIGMGKLPARTVGDQCCIPLKDVISLKRDTQAKWRTALDELQKSDQKLGLRSLSWHSVNTVGDTAWRPMRASQVLRIGARVQHLWENDNDDKDDIAEQVEQVA